MRILRFFVFAVLLGAGWPFIFYSAREVFDFFDMSAFFDAAYRIALGQRPYQDFYFNSGPIHILIYGVFIKLLGANQYAIVAYMYATCGAVFLTSYNLLKSSMSWILAVILSLLIVGLFYLPGRHPWYDSTAWAFVFGMVLCIFRLEDETSQKRIFTLSLCFVTLCLCAILTKTNIGVAATLTSLIPFSLVTLRHRRFWKPSGLGAVSAFCVVVLTLLAFRISVFEFLHQTLFQYQVFDRLSRLGKLQTILQSYTVAIVSYVTVISVFLICLFAGSNRKRTFIPLLLVIGCSATAVFTSWTSSIHHDSVPPAVSLLVLLGVYTPFRVLKLRRAVGWLLVYLGALAFIRGPKIQASCRRPSEWMFRQSSYQNDYTLSVPAFRGWKCNIRYGEGLEKTVEFLKTKDLSAPRSLFVYPDATVIYALLGVESYKGAPFIFHNFIFPPPGPLTFEFHRTLTSNPPRFIVIHRPFENVEMTEVDSGMSSLGIDGFFYHSYRQVQAFGDFTIWENHIQNWQ